MAQQVITTEQLSDDPRASATRVLLVCGALAAPLFTVVAVIEIFTRPGFDLRRHDLSLLSNGDLGWIQITNFVLAGLLAMAGAVGIRWTLRNGRGRTWGPLLIGVFGLGYVGAGLFLADPMNGFPPGTPTGPPRSVSWHGWMHLVSGSLGFLALIVACFLFASRFAGLGRRGWAVYSIATGIVVLTALVGVSTGSQQAAVSVGLFIAGTLGLAWISVLSFHQMKQ